MGSACSSTDYITPLNHIQYIKRNTLHNYEKARLDMEFELNENLANLETHRQLVHKKELLDEIEDLRLAQLKKMKELEKYNTKCSKKTCPPPQSGQEGVISNMSKSVAPKIESYFHDKFQSLM